MQQVVFDFERQETAAGPKDTKGLAKCALLSGACAQVVQHQDGDCGGKGAIREGQGRCVTLHYGVWVFRGELDCERVTPLETGDPRCELPQRGGSGSRPGAKLK